MWELYRKHPDGRWLYDDSLDSDERHDLTPAFLRDPKPERITLADGREVDAMVGEGGLAMVQE